MRRDFSRADRCRPGIRGSDPRVIDQLFDDEIERVVLMTAPPDPCPSAEVRARLEADRESVSRICSSRRNVVCGPDVYTLLQAEDFDGCDVHPNATGHRKIGEALAAILETTGGT